MEDQTLNDQATTGSVQQTDFIQVSRAGIDTKELVSDIPVPDATQTALDGKKDDFTENTAFNKDFGTIAGKVVEGNDSRLSDNRTCNNTFDNITTTKTNLALENVDNTSDADKPVSTVTQTALDLKINNSDIGSTVQAFNANAATTNDPQTFTAEQNFTTVTSLVKTSSNANTSITPILADGGTKINTTAATAVTFTVPLNASVAFPTGTTIVVWQDGAGLVTFAATGGVTIKSDSGKLSLGGQYTGAVLTKQSTDIWELIGNLV